MVFCMLRRLKIGGEVPFDRLNPQQYRFMQGTFREKLFLHPYVPEYALIVCRQHGHFLNSSTHHNTVTQYIADPSRPSDQAHSRTPLNPQVQGLELEVFRSFFRFWRWTINRGPKTITNFRKNTTMGEYTDREPE